MSTDKDTLRRWSWAAIAGLAAVLALVTWLAWPEATTEPPRAREFRDYDACLLTGPAGLTDDFAKRSWDGLQEVQKRTNIRVSFLTVIAEGQAEQFLATQVQQRCGVIVVTGEAQIDAASSAAPRYPLVRFVLVDGAGSGPNVSNVAPDGVADHVTPMVPRNQ